jgi:hypothetical protein
LSNPREYIYAPKSKPSPTIVYHEIGHRAFWLIEEKLNINLGGPNNFLHIGLLEYFTASLANHPVIMDNIFPNSLTRNVDKRVTYPNDFFSVRTTIDLLSENYKNNSEEYWHKLYHDLYNSYGTILDSIPDGHRSSMMIAHPLWKLRNAIGVGDADKLIAKSILNLPEVIKNRPDFLKSKQHNGQQMEWYDLIYSLIQTDNMLFNGVNKQAIIQSFRDSGYKIELINF